MANVSVDAAAPAKIDLSRAHPGFTALLLMKALERFAYYGVLSTLGLYLIAHSSFAMETVSALRAVLVGLAVVLAVVGAFIADRFIGPTRSISVGASLMTAGCAALAIDAADGGAEPTVLFGSVAFIALGSGLVTPSVPSVLGSLYGEEDPHRDGGFVILYVVLNLAAFTAPLASGYVRDHYGWAYGFGLSAAAMLCALVIYVARQKTIEDHARLREAPPSQRSRAAAFILCAATLAAAYLLLTNAGAAQQYMDLCALAAFAVLFAYISANTNGAERTRVAAAFVLIVYVTLFWTLLELARPALAAFASRITALADWQVSPSSARLMAQLISGFTLVLASAPLAWFWTVRARARRDTSPGGKIAFALILVGSGLLAVVLGAQIAERGPTVSIAGIAIFSTLYGLAELVVASTGMSAMTRLAPARMASLLIAGLFLAGALAQPLSARIAGFITPMEILDDRELGAEAALGSYVAFFLRIGLVGLLTGVTLLLMRPLLSRMVGAR